MQGWKNRFRDKVKLLRDRQLLKKLTGVKTWQLLIVLLLFILLAVIFLRLNNLGMIDRRNYLIEADKTGDVTKVQSAARQLQNYLANHMNTSAGRIPLQTLYNQALEQYLIASKPVEIDSGLHQRATDECIQQRSYLGFRAVTNCIAEKVGLTDTASLDQNQRPAPNPDAYYIEYAPVRWSFDLAGISLFICLLLIIIIVVRLIFVLILRIILKIKYRAV
jgi:hypothetical protein